jgi:Family of unknown function (DUF5677)
MTKAPKTKEGDSRSLRDILVEDTTAEFMENLDTQISHLENKAAEIGKFEELGSACRLLPGLLRATARQLFILKASCKLPIEVAAGACRTTFELNIRTRILLSDPTQFDAVQLEFVGDEEALLDGFLKLANLDEDSSHRKIIESRLSKLQAWLASRQLKSEKSKQIKKMAANCGVGLEYEALYRFYCKYVHGSAWLFLASDESREGIDFREILEVKTQQYAGDTYIKISDWLAANTPQIH